MKKPSFVKTAFLTSIGLSLLFGTLLFLNARSIPKYMGLMETGKHILKSVLEMQLQEQNYLLHHQEDALENVRDKIGRLRKLVAQHEKSSFSRKEAKLFEFGTLEEAINLCERLFDQLVLYDKAAEKNIFEIRELEKSILAVIFSKMNPERGIIALQEIRIHEKAYLLFRDRPAPVEARSFRDMRKGAVANLLMWAQKDKRIEELMAQDDQMFGEIINNYEGLDHALLAIKREREKIKDIADKFLEEGHQRLDAVNRRSVFLSTMLLIMWLITGAVVITTRFSG